MILQINLKQGKLKTNYPHMYVKLINDPFVTSWAEGVVKRKLDKTEHTHVASAVEDYPTNRWHKQIEELCRELPRQLSKVGMKVPAFFPGVNAITGTDVVTGLKIDDTAIYQHHMNQLHRWLVFCMFRTPYEIDGVNYTPEDMDGIFDKDHAGVLKALFTLNQLVHKTEVGYTSPGTATFPGTQHGGTMWDQGFTEDDTIGLAKDLKYTHLLTNNNHDVWLAKRILGKDFRECWLDADDPSYRDITNVGDILHYSFEVDPLNDDTEFYCSQEFIKWMKLHKRSTDVSEIGRIPLGKIINKVDNIKDIMRTCSIESIEISSKTMDYFK